MLTHLRLSHFRNYKSLDLEVPPGVVVFYGQNGQGKTNLVESIFTLLRGESFRPHLRENLILTPSDIQAARIDARIVQNGLSNELTMTMTQSRKAVELNNHRVSSLVTMKKFPLVLFSPESLSAIKEGPEQRRRLVDEVVISHVPYGAKLLSDYRKALKTRNKILKDFKAGITSSNMVFPLLESLDGVFFPLVVEVAIARISALQALETDFKKALGFILARKNVDISVEYLISGQSARDKGRSELLEAMHKRAQELRSAELSCGTSLVGPQRHDIRILFAGNDSRFFCSQGQQRAIILSFKMAQILYHYRAHQIYPFLLLDDVLSELDPARRTNLMGFLRDIPAQIFLTTTDLSFSLDFGDRHPSVFRIENGAVQKESASAAESKPV